MFDTATPKAFKGVQMTGPLLVQLQSAAVQAANKPGGGVLNIGSLWSAMLQAELGAAKAAAEQRFDKATKSLAECRSANAAKKMHRASAVS